MKIPIIITTITLAMLSFTSIACTNTYKVNSAIQVQQDYKGNQLYQTVAP